jgi:predicted phage terminase large subunit-like protein
VNLPSLHEIDTALAERSLAQFIRQAWPVIEPATEYLHNWHVDLIAEYLEAVTAGDILRLIVNIPPRYMKSIAISVMWPAWCWGPANRAGERWMFASYAEALSTKHSLDRRVLMQATWYQERWGDRVQFTRDQNLKTEYENTARGAMVSTSVGGAATGKGGDRLVVDDPLNPREALSDAHREAANTWFAQTFSTRLNDKRRGAIVVVMQRLNDQDLSGHLREQGGWEHLKVAAEDPSPRVYLFPRSGKSVEIPAGAPIWPEREGLAELAQQRIALGSYGYSGQYLQEPSPITGGLLKRYRWRYWYQGEIPPAPVQERDEQANLVPCGQERLPAVDASAERRSPADAFDRIIQSWDCTFKDAASSDYVVGEVWGQKGADFFLLDLVRARLDVVATVQAIKDLSAKWPQATLKLIEDKANGPAVIALLRKDLPGLVPFEPQGDKFSRVVAIQPAQEAGNIYLPHPAVCPWVGDFVEECTKFPNAAHDDQVDAMTQALIKLLGLGSPPARAAARVTPQLNIARLGAGGRF